MREVARGHSSRIVSFDLIGQHHNKKFTSRKSFCCSGSQTLLFGGREATTGNTSAFRRLGKSGPDRNMAVQDMLMAYRDTPHPATGISPYQAMINRPVRTKLDYTVPWKERSSRDKMMDEKDRQYKEKMADEGRSSKEHNFVVGDHVLLRQRKRNKWSTPYEPVFYTVIKISGSAITARSITDGREVQRDASQFKLANVLMYQESVNEDGQSEDWRETLLMGMGDMKDQPICQKDVEQKNLRELPEQETAVEPGQENPTEQSGRGSNQNRGTQRQFSENICSEDDLRSRIFGTFVVKFLACLPLLGFSNI